MPGLLDRSRTVAAPGFNRWLVPPAALCIHLCIGMAYGFSVFWLPLTHAVGIDHSVVPPPDATLAARLVSTEWDWDKPLLGWLYTLFFVFLGSSAALFGTWLERVGPRKAAFVSACCWCGGLLLSALAIRFHQLWLLWLGAGVIGRIGLGLGYISPVSTLMKWFPDRRGLATGLAIMGFGGGAMIGSPLADRVMKHFQSATSVGVAETFVTLSVFADGTVFINGCDGEIGWSVPPTGHVHLSEDRRRFRRGIPGERDDLPFLSLAEGLAGLRRGYALSLVELPEAGGRLRLEAVRTDSRHRGPARATIDFPAGDDAAAERIELGGLAPDGSGPDGVVLELVERAPLPADFFNHAHHHDASRPVDWE